MLADITTLLLAAGALGTVAFGIVEALKWWRFGEYGYDALIAHLGSLRSTLEEVYSAPLLDEVLRTLYRGNPDDLTRALRQGVRAGLTTKSAANVAQGIPTLDKDILVAAADAIQSGQELTTEQRSVLGKYELMADAKIDGSLAVAQGHYAGKLRLTAAAFAIMLALFIGGVQFFADGQNVTLLGRALLIGVLAVPVAPITHDLVDVIQSVASAIGPKS